MLKMTALAADKDYSLFREQGWSDIDLVAHGYAILPGPDGERIGWLISMLGHPARMAGLGAAISLGKTGRDAIDYAMEGSP